MFAKIVNYLFSSTKLGKLVDGHKTQLGFLLWLLGAVIEILAQAASTFPAVAGLGELARVLQVLHTQVSEAFQTVGLNVMIIGVGHKALKNG